MNVYSFINKSKNYVTRIGSFKNKLHRPSLLRKSRFIRLKGGKMQEKLIEQKLTKAIKEKGGIAFKFISPGFNGVPDRLILLPGGKIAFAEIKSDGEKLRPWQARRKKQLESLGFNVYVLREEKQISQLLSKLIGGDDK